jgi:hypothetical protein
MDYEQIFLYDVIFVWTEFIGTVISRIACSCDVRIKIHSVIDESVSEQGHIRIQRLLVEEFVELQLKR